MKKVVIISSTPRFGGNSEVLCRAFEKGALESGHEVVFINLREKKIHPCIGCWHCHNGDCVFDDDMKEIQKAMMEADVIVLGTPVYFYTMCGQLKVMIDRTTPFFEQLKGKEFYYIMTADDEDKNNLEKTVESIRGWSLDCLEGSKEKGIIFATGITHLGDAKGSVFEQEAYEMGKRI